ncbi:DUF7847 domain-containing protein [Archaeoglobus sp.]
MKWEVIRAGWEAWRRHPVTAVPFVLQGLSVIAVLLLIFLGVVYAIMPELPGVILSGKISEKPEEIIGEVFSRIAENIELISLLFILWLMLVTAVTTLFKAWWIKLCDNALECVANLQLAFQHAKSRFFPLFVYELIFAIITAVAFYPIINLAVEIFENLETISKETEMIVYYGISFLLWTVLLAILVATLSFLFTFVPYAIVIDGERTISGIKKGIKVLRRNIADTVIMWLLVGLANMAVQIPYYVLKPLGVWGTITGSIVAVIIGWVVAMPITTCWWVELYKWKSKTI